MKTRICLAVIVLVALVWFGPALHRAAGFAAARWAVRRGDMTETQKDMALTVLREQE